MTTIQDVARIAGVSTATVSRTFSSPELLNDSTLKHVLDVAAKLNYRPRTHNHRQQIVQVSSTSDSVGFLYFASDHPGIHVNEFYAPVMMGAQAEAAREGLHLILRTASRYDLPSELPKLLTDQATAGILLVGAALPKVLAEYLRHMKLCVLVDNRDSNGEYDCVLSDGFGGMYRATKYLIDLGHRRIAFVQDEPAAPSFADRRRGYVSALFDAGITPIDDLVLTVTRQSEVEPRAKALLQRPDRPTAIAAANDRNAYSVLAACRSVGLNVPDDLSIIGFDDSSFSIHTYPALTTVGVNKEQMGRIAVRQLLARVQERRNALIPTPPYNIVLPVELVKRDSCAPLRGTE